MTEPDGTKRTGTKRTGTDSSGTGEPGTKRTGTDSSGTGEPGTGFTPFADEAAVETIGGLSLENGGEAIAVHGSLDLTRDRTGLARARRLRAVLDAIVAALEAADLPEEAPRTASAARKVDNPFA